MLVSTGIDIGFTPVKPYYIKEKTPSVNMKKKINAKEYALKLLSIRMRSVKELREKLKEKRFDENEIEAVLEDLKNVGLLDDREFARAFYESRKRKLKSDFLVRIELLKKGIDEEIIEEVLSGDRAEDIKEKMKEMLKDSPDDIKRKRKVYQYFRRRGYTHSFVMEIMNEVLRELKGKEEL